MGNSFERQFRDLESLVRMFGDGTLLRPHVIEEEIYSMTRNMSVTRIRQALKFLKVSYAKQDNQIDLQTKLIDYVEGHFAPALANAKASCEERNQTFSRIKSIEARLEANPEMKTLFPKTEMRPVQPMKYLCPK